ncbi:MAG TPA: ATP-binding protein [Chitinophagaceae bacterium]|nr:ATP-binding protein [Chitinophagaceae bacterium]
MEQEWHKIISFNGSQANAFEELVCQVAMTLCEPGFKVFERVGTPDGGVECYWVLNDNTEWGWQAKYYQNLNSSEWGNIKNSLFRAVETHPELVRYYICLPHNLSDSRKNRNTQKAIWEKYKESWQNEISKTGRNVDIVLWNSTEIFSKLLSLQNIGIRNFFFGKIDIKTDQLLLHLDAAIDNLGPKYSPDLNFKLDYLPSVFDALSRNNRFQENFKTKLDAFLLKLNEVISDCNHFDETKPFGDPLKSKYTDFITIYEETDFSPLSELPATAFLEKIEETENIIKSLRVKYAEIETKYQKELQKKAEAGDKKEEYTRQGRKTGNKIEEITKYQNNAQEMRAYFSGPLMRAANEGIIFLTGKPGSGKSHLLADIALERKADKIPSIFLLGEHFPNQSPKLFIQQSLDPTHSLEDYLKAFESLAISKQVRLLFIIDAINEGAGKHIWKNSIAGLIRQLKQFKWIGFVFSYRSTYKDAIIPDNFDQPSITHNGFEGIEYEATKRFFEYYKIQQPAVPILNPEFSNPLFLKTFCITLNKSGKTSIPEGYEGISKILDEYIDAVNKNVGQRLNYPFSKINLVQKAIEELIKYQIKTDSYIIPWEKAYLQIEPILKPYSNNTGFLEELVKEGLLIEDFFYNGRTEKYEQHGIVFNYERFNEHLKALYHLSNYKRNDEVKKAFTSKGKLRSLFIDRFGFSGLHTGLLNAFAIILPEKFNLEIYQVFRIKDGYAQKHIYDAFLQSIIWRRHDTINPESWNYVKKHLHHEENVTDFFDTILLLAANPANYYNANFVHNLLKDRSVGERDYLWSIMIDKLWKWYDRSSIKRIIDWCWSDEEKTYTKDDSIVLLGKILAWLFTSSNRHLRDRATKAFATLFIDRIHLLKDFIEEFKSVNDPYILERVIGGSFGAIVHSKDQAFNTQVAQYIYDDFFSHRKPPLNILTRDYGKGIIEFVVSKGNKLKYKKENLYPPFDYEFPTSFPDEAWIKTIEIEKEGPYTDEERGQAQIPHSVLHWDFSRYILGTNHGSAIPFVNYPIKSRQAYEQLKKNLKGYKGQFFKIYTDAVTMINGTSELGKKLRRIFQGADLGKHLQFSKESRDHAYKFLKEKFTKKEWQLFEDAQAFIENGFETHKYHKKRFDVGLVQRYILKKVFDLGWEMKYFGKYDANVDSEYRRASKSERIGKKYQWIAYYEIMALLSDNFDFLHRYSDNNDSYLGTWQHNFRNIDPTCISKKEIETETDNNTNNWWLKDAYSNWDENRSTWLARFDDMPDFEKIITFKDENQEEWYLLYERIIWQSPKQIGKERFKAGRKELWTDVKALIVSKRNKSVLFNKGSDKLFWLGTNTSEILNYYHIFLGELYHSYSYDEQTEGYLEKYPYSSFVLDTKKVNVIHTVEEYRFESEYDLSDARLTIYKPSKFLFELLEAETGKNDACIYNKLGEVIAYDIGAYSKQSPNSFIIKKKVLDEYLEKNNLELIWFFCGEKEDIGPQVDYVYRMLFSGFLAFINGKYQYTYHHQLER